MRWWYKLRYIYLFHKWINKLSSEESKVIRALFEARKVAGSATYIVKQYETVLSFKVSLFIQSWKQQECVYFSFKNQSVKLFLFGMKCLPHIYIYIMHL